MRVVNERPSSLKAANRCLTNVGYKIRIFSVGFFSAAPPWIAGQIKHRGKALLCASRANFSSDGSKDVVDQCRVPGGSNPNSLRERRSFRRGVSVQALFMKQDGDSQPRVLLDPSLDGVGEFRHLPRTAVLARSRHLSQSIFQNWRGAVRKEFSCGVPTQRRLWQLPPVLPGSLQLRYFFLQGHARKQIRHALLDGQMRVAIGGFILRFALRLTRYRRQAADHP